jgi:2-amino-4-hydroxy-6-hydroxymethyldihydropteridine diphosphokinase
MRSCAIAAYLSAGSNLGDRLAHLRQATRLLRDSGIAVKRTSPVYETEPVGFRDQPWFLNVVIEVETTMDPAALLETCLIAEKAEGRIRAFRNAPRTLDIDVLLYDSVIFEQPGLIIPHPRMALRRFVLVPLAKLEPDLIHPVMNQTIGSLLDACSDPAEVRFFSSGDLL